MPAEIENDKRRNTYDDFKDCEEVFESEKDMKSSLVRLCHGDLYIIGKYWIKVLRVVLVGAKLSFIPNVNASVQAVTLYNACPRKPPKMKASDLPVYDYPHSTYKEHTEDKNGCTNSKKKIIHSTVFPYVRSARQSVQKAMSTAKVEVVDTFEELRCDFKRARKEFTCYMRDPVNLNIRRGAVALGAGLGYYIGSGRGIPRRLLFTSFGAATAGMLCFPKETDVAIRETCYLTGKVINSTYNLMLNKNYQMKEKQPCELQKLPEKKIIEKCPEEK